MAGDCFTLAVVGETNWAWDLDAVLAAVASTSPQADIQDSYPLAGSKFRARIHLPDALAGRNMQVILHESGKEIEVEYGCLGQRRVRHWVAQPLPTHGDVTVQDLLAIGP